MDRRAHYRDDNVYDPEYDRGPPLQHQQQPMAPYVPLQAQFAAYSLQQQQGYQYDVQQYQPLAFEQPLPFDLAPPPAYAPNLAEMAISMFNGNG
jgi:hypothetical protein